MAGNNELSEILGISSADAATLSGEVAAFHNQQGQGQPPQQPHRQQAPQQYPQPGQQPQRQPQSDESSFPTFQAPSRDTLALSDHQSGGFEDQRQRQQEPPQQRQQPQPQQGDNQLPPMMVPNTRLTEEADRRRQAEERARQAEHSTQRLEDRLNILQETFAEAQRAQLARHQQQQAPNPQEDLEGYVRWEAEQLRNDNKKLRTDLDEIRNQRQHSDQIEQINARAHADQWQFEQQAPDFQQAYHWWRNAQMAELTAAGYDAGTVTKHLDTMELQMAARAQQDGRNSAEGVYRAAVARGWRAPQMQQHEQQAQPQQATGTYGGGYQAPMGYDAVQQQNVTPIAQHPQYQPQAQYHPPQQQMAGGYQPGQWQPHNQSLDNMQAGMQQSRTLDSAPPGASAVPLDLEAYANMSDSDFMGHIDQVKAKMRALMA